MGSNSRTAEGRTEGSGCRTPSSASSVQSFSKSPRAGSGRSSNRSWDRGAARIVPMNTAETRHDDEYDVRDRRVSGDQATRQKLGRSTSRPPPPKDAPPLNFARRSLTPPARAEHANGRRHVSACDTEAKSNGDTSTRNGRGTYEHSRNGRKKSSVDDGFESLDNISSDRR